jgi:NAD(P)-dependent dehydrogenase (short-subunit alcohol dehydrogenase family)
MRTLSDRVAVVTGAASGIGRATAVALARKGCHVALVDVSAAGLGETAELIRGEGRNASEHVADVSSKERMRALPDEVEARHGGVHVLVNNAGVSVSALFEHHTLEDFEWLMGINFWGVIYGCKFFLPKLVAAEEAHVVNISSVFGIVGVPLNSSYCASKFAVRGFSEALRAELADTKVGVSSVHPGGVATNIVKSARMNEAGGFDGLHQKAVERFKSMLPPEKAAARIVTGILKNQPRILITREAYVIDYAKRLFPAFSSELVGRKWREYVAR